MNTVQKEHKEWLDREYPEQPATIPLTGMVEEAGELLHAILKQEQERIWGADPRYTKLQDDLVDAVGDCALYACSLCNTVGQAFDPLSRPVYYSRCSTPLECATALVGVAATGMNRQDYRALLDEYLDLLVYTAGRLNVDFEKAVLTTWQRVKLRSRKQKRPRIVCLCGSTRFKDAWYAETKRLTHEGCIVLGVGDLDTSKAARTINVPVDAELKLQLDALHFRKIDLADEVFVLNEKTAVCDTCSCADCDCSGTSTTLRPYIGYSTRNEITYARITGKPVKYLHEDPIHPVL